MACNPACPACGIRCTEIAAKQPSLLDAQVGEAIWFAIAAARGWPAIID